MDNPEVITFDCYGTLIDWESGIKDAFRKALSESAAKPELLPEALKLYEAEEARIEREQPHPSYNSVLKETTRSIAKKIGWKLADKDGSFLAKALPEWTPFPDTNPALERLARKHSLGILSNVDNNLLSATLKHFNIRFDLLITAENVRSYKPRLRHFDEARRVIGERPWVHVAGSFYHDIQPAMALGIRAVWVNRRGVIPPHSYPKDVVVEVRNLSQVADLFDSPS